jgi:hypothetical protein
LFLREYVASRRRIVDGRITAGTDGERYPQHLRKHVLDHIPVNLLGKQQINVLVPHLWIRTEEMQVLPVPDPRLELNAEQMRESEYRCTLALSIRVDRLRLYVRLVLLKEVEDMVAFPRTAGCEAAEQGNVQVGYEVVSDPAVAAVADVVLRHEILRRQVPFRPVS